MTESAINNIQSQMRKGMLEYCVLLLISHQRAYPSAIISDLLEANMIVVEGTLYTLLNRLRREGKLTYEWEESSQGPPRKYYSITEEGQQALEIMSRVWNDMCRSVEHCRRNTDNRHLS